MSLYSELKDRKVIRVAAVYLVVAWLIMQVVAVVSEPLLLPDWFARVVILLLTLGFPIALILSWAFDATPAEGSDNRSGKPLAFGLIAATAIVIGFIVTGFNSGDAPEGIVAVEVVQETALAEESTVLPNSVAVLPFENLSLDPEDAFIAAGFHESILNQLVKIRDINVIARTSVQQYENDPPPIPEIAEALRVETVMEGSVRYADDRILVTAQLIDGRTGSHLWSEEYNRDLVDIFGLQADIATRIALSLEAVLSPAEQQRLSSESTTSTEATALFLKSQEQDLTYDLSIQYLDQAIEIDPEFALAYARRAYETAFVLEVFEAAEVLDLIEQVFQDSNIALALDPELGFAHVAQGQAYRFQGRTDDARSAFEQGLALSPNNTEILDRYAVFYSSVEDFTQAVQLTQQAIRLDPNNSELYDALGDVFRSAKNPEGAADAYQRALVLDNSNAGAHIALGWAEIMRGDYVEASAQLRVGEILRNPVAAPVASLQLAYGYALLGRQEDADRWIGTIHERIVANAEYRNSMSSIRWALLRLAERNPEGALTHINEELSQIESGAPPNLDLPTYAIKYNLLDDPILDEPRFVELRSQLGYQD